MNYCVFRSYLRCSLTISFYTHCYHHGAGAQQLPHISRHLQCVDHGPGRAIHICLWAQPVAGRTSRVEDRPGQRGLPSASVQVPLVTRGHYLVRVRTSAHSQRHHSLCADRGPVSLTAYPSWAKVVETVGVADCQCPAVACPVHVLCCLHVLLQQYAPILRLRFSITFIHLSHSLPPPPPASASAPLTTSRGPSHHLPASALPLIMQHYLRSPFCKTSRTCGVVYLCFIFIL